jgi:hypothetical protein
MAALGETLGSPWPPLDIRPCLTWSANAFPAGQGAAVGVDAVAHVLAVLPVQAQGAGLLAVGADPADGANAVAVDGVAGHRGRGARPAPVGATLLAAVAVKT